MGNNESVPQNIKNQVELRSTKLVELGKKNEELKKKVEEIEEKNIKLEKKLEEKKRHSKEKIEHIDEYYVQYKGMLKILFLVSFKNRTRTQKESFLSAF